MKTKWWERRIRKRRKEQKEKRRLAGITERTLTVNHPQHIPSIVEPQTATPKSMFAKNEFMSGKAEWHMIDGLWRCVEVTESLKWMLKMEPSQAKLELARRGFDWNWIGTPDA